MKKRLNGRETLLIATMLFGMFFGAGNLIFPVYMGQLAGQEYARRFVHSGHVLQISCFFFIVTSHGHVVNTSCL